MTWLNKKVGLALGGGGSRGLAHIGVLSVLEKEGIHIDMIAGTSMGAIIGGAYACGVSPVELRKMVSAYLRSPEFLSSVIHSLAPSDDVKETRIAKKLSRRMKSTFHKVRTLFKPGAISLYDFRSMINYFIPDKLIEETRIPFRAVATDLITGERVVFYQGSIRDAVLASCAVPGAIDPFKNGDKLLSDGGITSLVPVNVLRECGADMVIAVAVGKDVYYDGELKTATDVVARAGEITAYRLKNYELRQADVVIKPTARNDHWADFSRAMDLIHDGELATRKALKEIRRTLPLQKKLERFWRNLTSRG
ncbi:MAG: patatin-like phospholipase family protein [Syntrophales bacterium]|jgi:NTE family protein|nr:patatin-like phospholipase family protein [Syntrophales bacterium]